MASIELRLSSKMQENMRQEVLIRLYQGSRLNLRGKSRIFVSANFFEYYIDRASTTKTGVKVPDKTVTISLQDALKKGYSVYDRGEIVIKSRVQTEAVIFHKEQKNKLNSLIKTILDAYETTDKESLKSDWLELQIDKFHNPYKYIEVKREDLLPKTIKGAMQYFIDGAPTRIQEKKHNAGKPIMARTLIQYKNTQKRVIEYLAECGKDDIALKELGKSFYDDFISYLNAQGYSKNTNGKHVKNIKAMINILPMSCRVECEFVEDGKCNQLSEDIANIALTEDELKTLAEYPFKGYLDRVRDEFLLLCWTGCRYSDLSKLTKTNIIDLANGKAFSFSQQKTGAEVVIPIMPEIQDVLEKHSFQMQKPMANQVFNRFLKEMCRKAGLTDIVKIKRTEGGVEKTFEHEKCDIVSAHTARRSFATNFYKRGFPTLMIMAITGHSTEKSFLKYIKVSKEENAELMLKQLEKWAMAQKS